MLDSTPDVIYKIDENGYFEFLNKSIERFGYTREELIGKHYSTIIHP
ncbi:PAS domain-containing protein, partial [Candidatus Woesearchaeota archaeon]|nr:PAS domain-containing protein [Candidatus Woesearchaeota archaeon]